MRYGLLGDRNGLHNIWQLPSATVMAALRRAVFAHFAFALVAATSASPHTHTLRALLRQTDRALWAGHADEMCVGMLSIATGGEHVNDGIGPVAVLL